jgi:three-Cys-motif partner protein
VRVPPKETVWAIEAHTKAKHDILRRYLGAWFPKVASWESKLVYIDGFAGPGTYKSGEPGSPLVALDTLVRHQHFNAMSDGTTFVFAFVENDGRRVASLEVAIADYFGSMGGQPENIRYQVVQGTFEDSANSIVESIRPGNRLAPTLLFIDPFGFGGVKMDTIQRLTDFPKCEVLTSFMYNSLNRWITHPEEWVHVTLRELFNTDEYEAAGELSGAERRQFLHDLYKAQLRDAGSFKFALDFEMINLKGQNVYSLIYATRHIAGLEAMKDAMWKVDPSGSFRFSDRHAGTTTLFDGKPDVGPLRTALLEGLAGQEVTIERVHEYVVAETIYGPSHYRRAVLAPLEKDGLVTVVSSSRKRANGYPAGTVLRFADA